MVILYPQIVFRKKKKSVKNIHLPPITILAMHIREKALSLLNKMGKGLNIDSFRNDWIKDLTDQGYGEELATHAVDLGIEWAKKNFYQKNANKKADLEEKEIWQMTFLEYADKKWGDNWMVGHRRLDEVEYQGKIRRQITQKDYRIGAQEYVQAVMQALSEGKSVPEEVLSDYHVSRELEKQSSIVIGGKIEDFEIGDRVIAIKGRNKDRIGTIKKIYEFFGSRGSGLDMGIAVKWEDGEGDYGLTADMLKKIE